MSSKELFLLSNGSSIFSLPNELIISTISSKLPCRELQIRSLATLLSIRSAPSRNIVLHGLEATGKSTITRALLQELSSPSTNGLVNRHAETLVDNLRYAIVKSAECIGGRHLLEQTVGAVAKAVNWKGNLSRCENLSQLAVETGRLLEDWTTSEEHEGEKRFVLVFDGIDRQRDAPPTLLPALARLGEIIPHLTTIFITTSPRPNFLHTPGVPHISFPAYTKPELLSILTLTTPTPLLPKGAQETQDTWSRFCSAVWDSIAKHTSRSLVSFRDLCLTLWPKFIAPVLSNQLSAQPFSKLLLANRALFQNDGVVVHNIVSTTTSDISKSKGIGTELPYYSRLLLVASYLASFNRPQTDSLFFMKTSSSKRRKRGGGTALTKTSSKPGVTKHRKIARKLLGPQAFILERMLAIFHAIKADATGGKGRGKVEGSADIYSAIATLASLRLLVKLGPGNANDSLEGGARYRVAVGWEVVRGVARTVGVEVEDYLAE